MAGASIEANAFLEAVSFAKKELKVDFELKDLQIGLLKEIYEERDCIGILPTGYGKSLIFQLVPWLLQKKHKSKLPHLCIVVSPLNSLMEDQVLSLVERGVKACFLNAEGNKANSYELQHKSTISREGEEDIEDDDGADEETQVFLPKTSSLNSLRTGEYCLIYAHPETLTTKVVRELLTSDVYQKRVGCIAIDEVHMIAEWGEEFRPKFKRIGDLITLFPDHATQIALTATATEEVIKGIKVDLNMMNPTVIRANPDRPNIYLDICVRLPNVRKFDKYNALIGPYCEELREKRENFDMTIIYVDNLDCLGYCYQYLEANLGELQYNGKEAIPENRLFAMYHSKYTNKMKNHVVKELRKVKSCVRLVLATVALGMGLNAPSITRVVHLRPPTTLQQFFQEVGRAGRSGQKSSSTLFYNNSDIAKNRQGMTDDMRGYCQSEKCLRITLMKYFGFEEALFNGSASDCCCVCKKLHSQ